LSVGRAPQAPTHGWGSYFIEVLAEASSYDYTYAGHKLIAYEVQQ